MLNWQQIEGKWEKAKGEALARWGELTEDEITEARGNREKLLGLIQERYGKAREEAEEELAAWQNDMQDRWKAW